MPGTDIADRRYGIFNSHFGMRMRWVTRRAGKTGCTIGLDARIRGFSGVDLAYLRRKERLAVNALLTEAAKGHDNVAVRPAAKTALHGRKIIRTITARMF